MNSDPVDIAELLDSDALYHLATAAEWEAYRSTGVIDPPSLTTEGFVHCSWGRQVAATVGRHFAGVTDLRALRLDPEALGETALVEEDSYGSGQAFPHAYGAVPVSAVLQSVSIA